MYSGNNCIWECEEVAIKLNLLIFDSTFLLPKKFLPALSPIANFESQNLTVWAYSQKTDQFEYKNWSMKAYIYAYLMAKNRCLPKNIDIENWQESSHINL